MNRTKALSNFQDVIDSRDVIDRIEELTALKDAAQESAIGEKETMEDNTELYLSDEFTETEYLELKALTELQEEAGGYAADWKYGETLIRDSYFQTYAQELAEDIGAIPSDNKWPCACIDWEQAARELQYDYTQVDFDGVAYWIR
jgi:hypothetical protein